MTPIIAFASIFTLLILFDGGGVYDPPDVLRDMADLIHSQMV